MALEQYTLFWWRHDDVQTWNLDGWPGDFHQLYPKVWFGIGHHKSASNLHGSPDGPWLIVLKQHEYLADLL